MSELTVIIPAFNEAESLRQLLPPIVEYCQKHDYRLIVVDDGSTDETATVLEGYRDATGLKLVTHKLNRGYGGAIKSGIRAAGTTYAITIDADGQHDLDDVGALYEQILEQDADLVIGSRIGHPDSNVYRGLGKRLIRGFARLLMPVPVEDINSGMKIYRTDLAQRYMRLCPDHMAFSDIITLVFISQKRRVLERPINIRPRLAGRSTISTLTAVETVREILNIVVLFNPMRVFFPISALAIAGSLVWGIPIVLAGRGVSVGALLGFSTGLLFFFLGLLAEQLSQIRKSSLND